MEDARNWFTCQQLLETWQDSNESDTGEVSPHRPPLGKFSWAVLTADGWVPGFTSRARDGTGRAVSHVETRALTSQHPFLLLEDTRGEKISIPASLDMSVTTPHKDPLS